jgi:hypothetical protein
VKIKYFLAATLPLFGALVFGSIQPMTASAAVSAVAVVVPSPSVSASAEVTPLTVGNGNQYKNSGAFFNDWGGGAGDYLNGETAQTANNDFLEVPSSGNYVLIESTNGNHQNNCVGDYQNSQTNARAGVDSCNGTLPWGANFTRVPCGSNGVAFKNAHWNNQWLNGGTTNGSAFYLNSTEQCFTYFNAV